MKLLENQKKRKEIINIGRQTTEKMRTKRYFIIKVLIKYMNKHQKHKIFK